MLLFYQENNKKKQRKRDIFFLPTYLKGTYWLLSSNALTAFVNVTNDWFIVFPFLLPFVLFRKFSHAAVSTKNNLPDFKCSSPGTTTILVYTFTMKTLCERFSQFSRTGELRRFSSAIVRIFLMSVVSQIVCAVRFWMYMLPFCSGSSRILEREREKTNKNKNC